MDSTTYQTAYTTSDAGSAAASAGASAFFGYVLLLYLVIIVILIVSMWRLFVKAGKPGWAAIVPFYNQIVMLDIAGRPKWWLLLILFVPFFGWWVQIVSYIDFARSYGKSIGFGVFTALLPFFAFPVLAFSKARYVGPVAKGYDSFVPVPEQSQPSRAKTAPF